jgi:hypothetical protein
MRYDFYPTRQGSGIENTQFVGKNHFTLQNIGDPTFIERMSRVYQYTDWDSMGMFDGFIHHKYLTP